MTEQFKREKSRRSLPRIRLIVARGTLPSRGKDRMDFIARHLETGQAEQALPS